METQEPLKIADYGGSLPVENVQSLASNSLKEIPPRYLREKSELGQVSDDVHSIRIPIIDMSKLIDHDKYHDEMARLHSACRDWGFFQLVNHGVPKEVIENMKKSTKEFFNMTPKEKKVYSQLPNSVEGYGQAFVVSEEQKLDWADMFYVVTRPVTQRNRRFWSTHPSCFMESLDKYSSELHKLGDKIIEFMARNLKLNSDAFTGLFNEGQQGIRINFYPPCNEADKVLGISPHSDSVGLTLLLQVSEFEGLQIKKNGYWVPVKPILDAFIVNVGDIIEIMSNGEYKSIEHRAVVDTEKERISIVTFHNPNMKSEIGPLADLVKESKAKYKTVSYDDFLREFFNRKLDGKSMVDYMTLQI